MQNYFPKTHTGKVKKKVVDWVQEKHKKLINPNPTIAIRIYKQTNKPNVPGTIKLCLNIFHWNIPRARTKT